jgi:hypothetical protein
MNSMEGGTYYCAHPHVSTRMINSACVVRDRLAPLVRDSERLSAGEFKVAYERFLSEVQVHL